MKKGIYRTGTSNIVIPGNKSSFPVEYRSGSRLHYYASLFNSLEVNSSFYKIPMAATFAKWAADVPDDFQFTIKLWEGITHAKDLSFSNADVDRFMQAAAELGTKKGCLLVQFPASIHYSYHKKLKELLQRLQKNDPANTWRKAIEFRHNSWYQSDTYKILKDHKAAVVWQDIPRSIISGVDTGADFILQRFHGELGDYKGSYPLALLHDKAIVLKKWLNAGKDVYAYFNNTMGDAFENARTLRAYITTS